MLWNNYICTIYIRESRYTKQFIDDSDYFTISFFYEIYKDLIFPNNFIDDKILINYEDNDYHTMYIRKIEKVLIK